MIDNLAVFTGIIEAQANIREITEKGISVERPESFDDIKIGSSISVSGACLSVVNFDEHLMKFDVVSETFQKTKLGSLKAGDKINLERAMKASDRFEGHVVQGHTETTGVVTNEKLRIENGELIIKVCDDVLSFLVPKGSIAIDGVSLTVATIDGNQITVALIPHTLENTTLGFLDKGDKVNIETDVMVRHAKQLQTSAK
ncbi:MAG: riboflavin synthase [Candidatus Peribacteraceae bacterium]|nr:riboflavin synthase [Candidatus Peribacteraceae bacterium]HCI03530.1 riboflavin synthase [Candidatus Peribacteria bacterium]